jgi:hypothetical protein
MSAKYTTEVTLSISVRELADMFVNLPSDDQAKFFTDVAFSMCRWPSLERDSQLLFIAKELKEQAGLGAQWVATLAEILMAAPVEKPVEDSRQTSIFDALKES